MLDIVDALPNDYIICGDFNCPGKELGSVENRLIEQLTDHNLLQYITGSTRKRNGNLLDLVIARPGIVVVDTVRISEIGFSDHNLVTFCINAGAPAARIEQFSFRNIKNIDTVAFMDYIACSALLTAPMPLVDDYYKQLKDVVTSALDKFAPLKQFTKRVGSKPTACWMTEEARELKKTARCLERRYLRTDTNEDYQSYRRASRKATKSVQAARASFYRNGLAVENMNSRSHWKMVNEVLHFDDRPPSTTIAESSHLVSSFTSYFSEKLNLIHTNILSKLAYLSRLPTPSFPIPTTPTTFFTFSPITISEVHNLLHSTPTKCSPLDFIPTTLLKSCSSIFAPLIAELANRSFTQGCFPSSLKIAQITPLLKKSGLDPLQPSSYCPISNLNTIGKLLERLALQRLCPHIITSPNFSPTQSTYRHGHSTETALLDITNRLSISSGKCLTSLLCTIDLSSAFDTIHHHKLLERLKSDFGIDGVVGAWLQSYLVDRQQFVKVGGALGKVTLNESGVPQGSVLGPILFTAYMSPISRIIDKYGIAQHHYADDTTLFIELDGPKDIMSNRLTTDCIDELVLWCLHNDMQINPEKTELMLVSSSASQIKHYEQTQQLQVAGVSTSLQDTVKILGVTLDSRLSFDSHISLICQACNYHLKALRHIRSMLSVSVANQLACSIVASRLDYCNSLLYGVSNHNLLKLQRIQNNLARIVCNAPARASPSPLLQKLHWLPIEQRIKYKLSVLTYTALAQDTPGYLRSVLNPYIPQRTLRSSDARLLNVPQHAHSLAIVDKAFSIAAPKVWNNLSLETRSANTLSLFKNRLKTELFVKAFSGLLS